MKKLILPFAALLLGFSTASNAVSMTYDFVKEGQIHEFGYEVWDSSDHNAALDPDHLTAFNNNEAYAYDQPGGLQISASNGLQQGAGYVGYSAYFDNYSSGKPAGLGVCKTGDANGNGIKGEGGGRSPDGCFANSDDNQMQGEYIHMLFDDVVEILSLDVTGDHAAVEPGAELVYSLDGGVSWDTQLIGGLESDGDDVHNLTVNWLLSNKTLDYTISPASGQMYLSAMTVSPVPVPAAFWLFGTALIGFVGLSRRTNLS